VDLNVVQKMGQGDSYIAPDSHFISSVSLFSSSLPWDKFERFFEKRKLVNLSGSEQLILLRLIGLQELLCLNDDALLKWSKHQLHLFSFMQPSYTPRMPTKELLVEFRKKFDEIGLLKPFRKQCQKIVQEHESRFPPILSNANTKHREASDTKVDLPNVGNNSDTACPSCGSHNVVRLTSRQEASSLPSINFSRCRFCGNTFRD
jgi:DNA-directed RNA polymerase subunit M/transcription elongation factor TFIIS